MLWNQSVDCLSRQTVGKGNDEARTRMWSPCRSSTRPRPSNEAQAVDRELYGTQMRSSMESGRRMGRKERVWGQMGVTKMAGDSGDTRDPPAESE
jgi:hypothetical protein